MDLYIYTGWFRINWVPIIVAAFLEIMKNNFNKFDVIFYWGQGHIIFFSVFLLVESEKRKTQFFQNHRVYMCFGTYGCCHPRLYRNSLIFYKKKDFIVTKVLDFRKPALDLKRRMGLKVWPDGQAKADGNVRYIYPIRFATPGRKYYPSPYWHSIIKSGWLEFANAIPEFKKGQL